MVVAAVKELGVHFQQQWEMFVGGVPTVEEVNGLLRDGILIRSQMCVRKRDDRGRWQPYKLLAEYWVWDAKLIIKVDEDSRKAVTLITSEKLLERRRHGIYR